MNIAKLKYLLPLFIISAAFGADGGYGSAPHVNGEDLVIFWIIPFAGILLSIAIFPLVANDFWHHNFGKISLFWALSLILPFLFHQGFEITLYEILHVGLLEYIPFIILLLSLFTISGGVRLKGTLVGTPILNTTIIFVGTCLASWMGTTGAAMLLIRPLIRANAHRKQKVHIIVFFIFLVANIGGSLTPLGDPPLFLGFLKGVDFFWTTTAMFMPMLFLVVCLLIIFFLLDSFYYKKENILQAEKEESVKLGIEGSFNLFLLLGVIGGVLLSGFWRPDISFEVYYVHLELQNIARDLLLLGLTYASWVLTPKRIREGNEYTWFPIVEVAKLFAGIFVTIIPAISILKAGTKGALEKIVSSVSTANGEPIDYMYFWLTGILSSFLDNAPTYLVFFNTIGGSDKVRQTVINSKDYNPDSLQLQQLLDTGQYANLFPQALMNEHSTTLLAISAGAVFMGAVSYIGNAPNFMVKAIAESSDIKMPSFFGYLLKWSIPILMPLFLILTYIFFWK
ncbi:MAG: sodium:proton antiporter [Candidatus Marinimicrobia bacterium]|nr:sodium:proton antiporter [Candidatus Neomarinimicrobiota bacterium]|tara:strand:+ start:1337 stop:2866 length:1530 start_codon:yes stop_codon:yes gene_type:complete